MAQPTPYDKEQNFVEYAEANPTAPFPPAALDAELSNIETAIDETQGNLALIQRDDGRLANRSVHPDAFDASSLTLIGADNWVPRGFWVSSTAYALGDIVEYAPTALSYVCAAAHISSDFTNDRTAGRWLTLFNTPGSTPFATAVYIEYDFSATAGQTVFDLPSSYTVGANHVAVYLDGLRLRKTVEWTETTATQITLASGALAGQQVVVLIGQPVGVTNTASAITFLQKGTGAIPRDVQTKLREFMSVADFGADSTGVLDSTTAIQTAIDAVVELGGGVLMFPNGTYRLTATLVLDSENVTLQGESMWRTILTRSTDYGDTLYLNNSDVTDTRRKYNTIRNMRFQSTGLTTSGAHIHINRGQYVDINHISIGNGFIGIQAESLAQATIDNVWIICNNLYGGTVTGRCYMEFKAINAGGTWAGNGDVTVSNFNFRQSSADMVDYGIRITRSDGIWFNNGHIGGASIAAMGITHTASEGIVTNITCSNVIFDSGEGYGVLFQGSNAGEPFRHHNFDGCRFLGGQNGLTGIYVASGCDVQHVTFTGAQVMGYTQHGIQLNSDVSGPFSFTGCHVYFNSAGGATHNLYNNMVIGPGVQHVTVSGGKYGGGLYDGSTSFTNYGIVINPTADKIVVSGVNLCENDRAGINLGTFGNNVVIDNCVDDTSGIYEVPCADTVLLPATGRAIYIVAGWELDFKSQTVDFAFGETVTGAGGATGFVWSQTDSGATGTLVLKNVTGVFVDGETLTGSLGGAALVDGTIRSITSITGIDPVQRDRIVILRFYGAVTVTDGGVLKLVGDYVTTINDTLTLICDGSAWSEIGRSGNI